MGVWEPLLEPLEDETRDGFRPWVLKLKVLMYTCILHVYSILKNNT